MSYTLDNNNTTLGENALNQFVISAGITGFNNAAFGSNALTNLLDTKSESTAVGAGALYTNQNGENTAVGSFAAAIGDGTGNTAVGNWALRFGAEGSDNTAIGYRSQASDEEKNNVPATTTSGTRNTSLGAYSLRYKPGGDDNTAIGYNSLNQIVSSGLENTAIGSRSLEVLTSGDGNVAVGKSAGDTITTGNNNTLLGNNANVDSVTASYRTVVGSNAVSGADNTVILGRAATDSVGAGVIVPQAKLHVQVPDANTGSIDAIALKAIGGQVWNTTYAKTDYSATARDHVIIANGNAAVTITLPDPTTLQEGQVFIIRNGLTAAFNTTVTTTSPPQIYSNSSLTSVSTITLVAPATGSGKYQVTLIVGIYAGTNFYYEIAN